MENSQPDSTTSLGYQGFFSWSRAVQVFPAPGKEIGRLDLGVDGNHVFKRERFIGLELDRLLVKASGRRQVGERVFHREETRFPPGFRAEAKNGDRRRLARGIERHAPQAAGLTSCLVPLEVGLLAGDQVRGQRIEILAESDAQPMIIGTAKLDFGDAWPDLEPGDPVHGHLADRLIDRHR